MGQWYLALQKVITLVFGSGLLRCLIRHSLVLLLDLSTVGGFGGVFPSLLSCRSRRRQSPRRHRPRRLPRCQRSMCVCVSVSLEGGCGEGGGGGYVGGGQLEEAAVE